MLSFLLHLVESGLSGYALYHASIAIPNLQKWESKSQRLAQYSNSVADELHKTRTTETIGVVASIFSIFTALFLTVGLISPGIRATLLDLVACIATVGASVYLGDFWDRKGKVPVVQSYNDAVESTKRMRGHLALLGILWGVSFFLDLF